MLERFLGSRVGVLGSRFAFLLPLLVSGPAVSDSTAACAGALTRSDEEIPYLVGLVAGAAWQLLNRRDPVDRFRWWAVLLTLTFAARAVWDGGGRVTGDLSSLSSVAGIVGGVVLAEAWLRHQDRKAVTRLPFAADELRELR